MENFVFLSPKYGPFDLVIFLRWLPESNLLGVSFYCLVRSTIKFWIDNPTRMDCNWVVEKVGLLQQGG